MAIKGLQQKYVEIGRIRTGEKSGKIPKSLSTFRLTSPNKTLLEAAATRYGGTVTKWDDAGVHGDQWQVVTEVSELPVLVPNQDVASRQFFELWSKGGCERRCDGETELKSDQPCICKANNLQGSDKACKTSTILELILPELPGIGVWVLTTTSYYAATEIPNNVDLMLRLSPHSPPQATLRIDHRKKVSDGKTKPFPVPVLDINLSVNQMLSRSQDQPALSGAAPTTNTPSQALDAAAQQTMDALSVSPDEPSSQAAGTANDQLVSAKSHKPKRRTEPVAEKTETAQHAETPNDQDTHPILLMAIGHLDDLGAEPGVRVRVARKFDAEKLELVSDAKAQEVREYVQKFENVQDLQRDLIQGAPQ